MTAERGPAPHFNMAEFTIGRAARAAPDKPALVVIEDAAAADRAKVWTFARLEAAVLGIAGGLAHRGLKPGNRLLLRLDNTALYPLVFFGAMAGGYVPVPVSPQLTAREAGVIAEDSETSAAALSERLAFDHPSVASVITAEALWRMSEAPARAGYAATFAEDPAFLVYTSGTSGEPKGVLHAHRSALGRRPMVEGWYGLKPEDRLLHAGAFNWTFTLGTGLTDPWANGATAIVYTGEKDPAVWPRLIEAAEATLFAAVPGVFRQILKYGRRDLGLIHPLRHGLMAGEAPPPGLFAEWMARTGRPLYEAFGMSEVSTFISSAPGVPRKDGAVGKAQPGRRVAILDVRGGTVGLAAGKEGVVAVHGSDPGLMLGYWRRPEDTAAAYRDGWFVTGDRAVMDEEGYVSHRGRTGDLMNAMGYRVAPQEIEAVLGAHPCVAEAACAEVRVRDDVTVIGAFVVLQPGAEAAESGLLDFAAARLAPYKCPRKIVFVPEIPRTANGKLMRRLLAEIYAQGASQAGLNP
jgi:acyl-coenzyme A synthetase/AMP-(fatty) acid ligase